MDLDNQPPVGGFLVLLHVRGANGYRINAAYAGGTPRLHAGYLGKTASKIEICLSEQYLGSATLSGMDGVQAGLTATGPSNLRCADRAEVRML